MVLELKLLIVEDEQSQLDIWDSNIAIHNAEKDINGYSIDQTQARSLVEAEHFLEKIEFDAAIIDLRLKIPDGKGANDHGNNVLKMVLENQLIVVAVYSAETAIANIPTDKKRLIKLFTKGTIEGTKPVFNWLKSNSGLIIQMQRSKRNIKNEMAKIFNDAIWPRWNYWVENNPNHEDPFIENALTRHITAHVYAAFLEKSHQKAHPEEWYFVPPIRKGLRTGDLFKNERNEVEILITPRCDLANGGKNNYYQLAKCSDISNEWKKLEAGILKSEDAFNKAKAVVDDNGCPKCTVADLNILRNKIGASQSKFLALSKHNGNKSVVHFLPTISLIDGTKIGPFFINFDNIRSVSRGDAVSIAALESGRFASVTTEFLPSIVERFGSYYSRIGAPDYSHPE